MNLLSGPRRLRRSGARVRLAALLALALLVLAGCAPEDPSDRFSPSAQSLLGEATGERVISPNGEPPGPSAPSDGWQLDIQLARFGELENRLASLEVLLAVDARSGAALELWLVSPGGPQALWRGGDTRTFAGTTCWQLPLVDLERPDVVLELPEEGPYTLVAAFRDDDGRVLAADSLQVTHFVPRLEGEAPGEDSGVFRDLLGCRRVGK